MCARERRREERERVCECGRPNFAAKRVICFLSSSPPPPHLAMMLASRGFHHQSRTDPSRSTLHQSAKPRSSSSAQQPAHRPYSSGHVHPFSDILLNSTGFFLLTVTAPAFLSCS